MTPDQYHGGQIARAEGEGHANPAPVPGVEVGIDWLSATFKDQTLAKWARDAVLTLHGGEVAEVRATGQNGFTRLASWPSGVQMLTGHQHVAAMLNVPGHACAWLGGDQVLSLLRVSVARGKVTRLDIRGDLKVASLQERLKLIEQVGMAREAGAFVGVRSSDQWDNQREPGGVKAFGYYFGSSKSERLLRIYDKGMEQGWGWAGGWVRWELQLRKDKAHAAAAHVVSAEDPWRRAWEIALSGVEFRENNGETRIERRPLLPWFAELRRGMERIRPSLEPVRTTIEGFLEAFRSQYGRVLVAAATEACVPVGTLVERVLEGTHPHDGTWKNPNVGELIRWYQGRRSSDRA